MIATFEKKAISILAGNTNSGRSYLITAVLSNTEQIMLYWALSFTTKG
jgi:hypothetical protein